MTGSRGWRVASLAAILLLSSVAVAAVKEDDIACLREFKESVTDPLGHPKNWDFRGNVNVCSFVGVTCLPGGERKVASLHLPAAGLGGRFPRGLSKCSSLTELNLSNNMFTGRFPHTICRDNPDLTEVDLSLNSFTGRFSSDLQINCRRFSRPSQDISEELDDVIRVFPDSTTQYRAE